MIKVENTAILEYGTVNHIDFKLRVGEGVRVILHMVVHTVI